MYQIIKTIGTSIIAISILASPRTYECCTLIATFSPVDLSFALCTWANDAAPRGLGSISLNISSTFKYKNYQIIKMDL